MDSPVRAVAQKLGVPIIELILAADGPAGLFALDASALKPAKAIKAGPSRGIEAALVLHTSGTTARPKIVPLSAANLAASARHIGGALALKPKDRCLNIMLDADGRDRKSTRLNSSHCALSRMPSSA